MKKMRSCRSCGRYTLSIAHCGQPTVSAHPARFNPRDRHAASRRKARYGV